IHGVAVGPTLVNEHPDVFWGFVASMYVGNLMLLVLNLPLVGLFVTVLRIPYAYLYPLIIMFCIIGVYEVNNSIVDVWIMLIMGVVGYALRKFDFDPAPLVLGLVISPILEQSLRQSLIMSNGNYLIFFSRPISLSLMIFSIGLLVLAAYSFVLKRADWRTKLAEAEARETETRAISFRADSDIAIRAAPPKIMLMPTSRPSAQAAVLGSPAKIISASARSMMPLTSIQPHRPDSSRL